MSKHVTVTVDGMTLADADFDQVDITLGDNAFSISGKNKGTSGFGGLSGLAEALSKRSVNQTQDMVEAKKAELAAEKAAKGD